MTITYLGSMYFEIFEAPRDMLAKTRWVMGQ